MPELLETLNAMREKDLEDKMFQVRLAGGDPDEGGKSDFDRAKDRAKLRADKQLLGLDIDVDNIGDEIIDAMQMGQAYMVDTD